MKSAVVRQPAGLPTLIRLSCNLSAGDYPLPDQADSLGIGDTLAQLSDLSQATVYHSATVLEVRGTACWTAAALFHAF
jgi:hypothetical protein